MSTVRPSRLVSRIIAVGGTVIHLSGGTEVRVGDEWIDRNKPRINDYYSECTGLVRRECVPRGFPHVAVSVPYLNGPVAMRRAMIIEAIYPHSAAGVTVKFTTGETVIVSKEFARDFPLSKGQAVWVEAHHSDARKLLGIYVLDQSVSVHDMTRSIVIQSADGQSFRLDQDFINTKAPKAVREWINSVKPVGADSRNAAELACEAAAKQGAPAFVPGVAEKPVDHIEVQAWVAPKGMTFAGVLVIIARRFSNSVKRSHPVAEPIGCWQIDYVLEDLHGAHIVTDGHSSTYFDAYELAKHKPATGKWLILYADGQYGVSDERSQISSRFKDMNTEPYKAENVGVEIAKGVSYIGESALPVFETDEVAEDLVPLPNGIGIKFACGGVVATDTEWLLRNDIARGDTIRVKRVGSTRGHIISIIGKQAS